MGRPVLEVWGSSSRFILPSCPLGIFHPTVALQWATEVMIVCTPNLIHSIRYHSPDRLLNSNNIFNVHSMQIHIYILVSLSFTKHQLIPLPFHQLCNQKTAATSTCHRPSHHAYYQSTVFHKPGAILVLQIVVISAQTVSNCPRSHSQKVAGWELKLSPGLTSLL